MSTYGTAGRNSNTTNNQYYNSNLLHATNSSANNYTNSYSNHGYSAPSTHPKSMESLYTDGSGGYSVHVVDSDGANGVGSNGISVKNNFYGHNASFDYVPASAFCQPVSTSSPRPELQQGGYGDNYSVYVNGKTS